MRQVTTKAILLKRLNFGEADRIITVLTPDGISSLLAKGVRKAKSKLAGGIELFSITDITYIDGRSDLKTITSTRLAIHFRNIVQDINRTMSAYDFMKYINKYAEHSQDTEYFDLLSAGLENLDKLDIPYKITYIWFSLRLLQISGSSLNLEKPLNSKMFHDEGEYSFSYEDMMFLESSNGEYTARHIKLLRLFITSDSPARATQVENIDEFLESLEVLTKQALRYTNQGL